jgi:uncharacterized protein (TIGR02246 family)
MKPRPVVAWCASLSLVVVVTIAAAGRGEGAKADPSGAGPTGAGPSADEQAVRELDRQWVAAVAKKDAPAVAEFYAPRGQLMAPNAPSADGRDAVAGVWKSLFALPGFSLTFEPKQIDVASAGDMACDVGTYALGFDSPDGAHVRDSGKYVVVWRKVDGHWKVMADIFNSDLPRS